MKDLIGGDVTSLIWLVCCCGGGFVSSELGFCFGCASFELAGGAMMVDWLEMETRVMECKSFVLVRWWRREEERESERCKVVVAGEFLIGIVSEREG